MNENTEEGGWWLVRGDISPGRMGGGKEELCPQYIVKAAAAVAAEGRS